MSDAAPTERTYRSVAVSTEDEDESDGSLLTNKIHELTISSSPRPTSTEFYIFPRGRPPQRILIEEPLTPYKPLPDGWENSEGHWAYGFPYTDEYLSDFALRYVTSIGFPDVDVSPKTAFHLLEDLSGYRYISWLPFKADRKAIADGLAVQSRIEKAITVKVLILNCTASQRLFKRRPTEVELECLIYCMGHGTEVV